MQKPFYSSSENNKQAILQVLETKFAQTRHVLEIGTGTAQHAVFFAPILNHLIWHTSDLQENHAGINLWIDESGQKNLVRPFILDVMDASCWQHSGFIDPGFDGCFTANTAHIMSMAAVQTMFYQIGAKLLSGGLFVLYGPFNRSGEFTSDGNQAFDSSLRAQDPLMGIRDDQTLIGLAEQNRMSIVDDVDMPSNNRMLCFKKWAKSDKMNALK